MSSPNLNAASILRNQATRSTNSSTSNLSGMKTVYVGKDQHPVTITEMAHVNEAVWKKSGCFENLYNTAHSLLEAHSTADIMALIAQEIPMDTGAAFQEAQAAAKVVTDEVFNICNLHPSAFLNSDGKTLKFAPTVKLSDRPEDLTFFRFQCDLDGNTVDKRVTKAGDLSFQYCLRLPQHLFNVTNNTVEDISKSPGKESMTDFMHELNSFGTPTSAKKKLFDDNDSVNEVDPKDKEMEYVEEDETANAQSVISPKFKGMVGKDDKVHKKGYYGPFNFFNTQCKMYASY